MDAQTWELGFEYLNEGNTYFIIMIYNYSLSGDVDLPKLSPGFCYTIYKHKMNNSMQGISKNKRISTQLGFLT